MIYMPWGDLVLTALVKRHCALDVSAAGSRDRLGRGFDAGRIGDLGAVGGTLAEKHGGLRTEWSLHNKV
jgi:hypothetical protein